MKKIFLCLLPLVLLGSSFETVIKGVDNNLLLKSRDAQIQALRQMSEVAKAKNYPKIDLSFDMARLKDTPTTLFVFPPFPAVVIPLGTKNNVNFKIGFVYPLFTGYAISSNIKKSKIKYIKAKLEKENLKRELYLKAVELYGGLYASNQAIKATEDGLRAIDSSLKKAQGLYKNDLLNLSGVYNIEAKKFQIEADMAKLKAKRDALSNQLAYLCGLKLSNNTILKNFQDELSLNNAIKIAIKQRKDILAIKEQLKISEYDIKLAKSLYYPTVALVGAIKKQGDNLKLNGNGYTNADSSYIGLSVKWNLFDGFANKHQEEAAFRKKEATVLFLEDYKRRVETNIKNSFLNLKALNYMLKASKKELVSQQEYYKLTKGRFDNQLCSADELSRAISSLSQAKAKVQEIKAKIFVQRCKIALEMGLDYFSKRVL